MLRAGLHLVSASRGVAPATTPNQRLRISQPSMRTSQQSQAFGEAAVLTCFPEPVGWSSMDGVCADRGETGMSQLPQNLPVSRDQVLDEVEFLLTVEHALIVEYLSVRCALGYDLDTAHGGPVNEASREAAAEANSQADLLMLKADG